MFHVRVVLQLVLRFLPQPPKNPDSRGKVIQAPGSPQGSLNDWHGWDNIVAEAIVEAAEQLELVVGFFLEETCPAFSEFGNVAVITESDGGTTGVGSGYAAQ